MTSTTAAGSAIAISTGTPATLNAAGYAALAWDNIGLVDKIGTIGKVFAKVEFQALQRAKDKLKGSADHGALTPSMAYDETDAGQITLRAAADDSTTRLYPIRVTYPSGEVTYFRGRVFGAPEGVEGADSIIMTTATIEICTPRIRVPSSTAPAPVFTAQPSISPTSGAVGTTFTANDGSASNATGYTRRWLLGTTAIGTGTTVTPNAAGALTLEVTATGPGGTRQATSTAITVAAGGTPTPTPAPMMARLKRANTAALAANPEDQTADATLATLTMGSTADASLTKVHGGVAGGQVAMPSISRFTGGRFALESNSRAIFPVANAAPANGSLSALLPSTPGYSAWGYEQEFEYTGSRLQFRLSGNVARGWRVRVNGKYVSKTATMNIANSSSNYLTIDFPTGTKKVVTLEGSGSDQIVQVAMGGTDTIAQVASPPEGAISLNTGDSYSEGTGATIPGLFAWVKIAGRRLGETDIRQVAVGSTGYLSNNGGARKTIRQQVADWPVVNSDISMSDVAKVRVAGGYNDYAQANMPTLLQPEVLATLQAIRAMCPNATVMVYGSHTGARGPDATTIQVENLIKAAFDQWADSNSAFIPIATASPPWITGTGYAGATNGSGTSDTLIGPDGSHPNDAGHKVIADKSVAAERAIYATA